MKTGGHNQPRRQDEALEQLRVAYSQRMAVQFQALQYCRENQVDVPFWAVQDTYPAVQDSDLFRVITECCHVTVLKPLEDLTPYERRVLASLARLKGQTLESSNTST